MLKLLIARHGNTFDSGDDILRVGLKTDIPLSTSGKSQAKSLGLYLSRQHLLIDNIYCSELKRTQQTAKLAASYLENTPPITTSPTLNELDYGEDDGRLESEVVRRLGVEALKRWDESAIPPPGWPISSTQLTESIKQFANQLRQRHHEQTILLVTSNGIARFFLYLLTDYADFIRDNPIKLATGSISELCYDNNRWTCSYWGLKP